MAGRAALSLVSLASLLAFSHAAPVIGEKPTKVKRQENPTADGDVFAETGGVVIDAPTGNPVPPPNASGALYAPNEDFLGNDGNPANLSDSTVINNPELVPGQEEDGNLGLYLDFELVDKPEPIRGDIPDQKGGSTDPGPDTSRYNRFESDIFASPNTDGGSFSGQFAWPMGLSHNRLGLGKSGWARQQNIQNLPLATAFAGVDMRLAPNAYREMHWHKAGEWAYVLTGSVRVATVNENGENFVDDLNEGDLWFFPPGVPHSLQALENGVEFLLVFDSGVFSEENTSLATELFIRNPRAVLAKNMKTSVESLNGIPTEQKYIFPGTPAPTNISEQNVTGPAGYTNQLNTQFTYHLSQQQALEIPGAGSVKIVDPTTFPAAADFSVALIRVQPGAMRELHWHPTSDEWNFFVSGQGRITIYQAPSSSQTFDYGAGDVGYIPQTFSHYIENTGSEDMVVLEVLKAPKFSDISVNQWLAMTPRQVVKDTLNLSDTVLDNLPKYKSFLIPGPTNLTSTNYTAPFPKK